MNANIYINKYFQRVIRRKIYALDKFSEQISAWLLYVIIYTVHTAKHIKTGWFTRTPRKRRTNISMPRPGSNNINLPLYIRYVYILTRNHHHHHHQNKHNLKEKNGLRNLFPKGSARLFVVREMPSSASASAIPLRMRARCGNGKPKSEFKIKGYTSISI